MRLIISGGGSGKDTKEQNELFVNLLDKSKPLLYIPIAIDVVKHPYSSCLEWLKSELGEFYVTKYEMWTIEDLEKSRSVSPDNYSGIYIGGGNTPFLLKKLKETGMWDFLKDAIKKDIPIMGGSAGAIIFAKSIIPSLYHDMNWVELKNFSGMDILMGREITCHYVSEMENDVKSMIKKEGLGELIALSNKNGLYVTDNEMSVVGQEPAIIFSQDKKVEFNIGEVLEI
jgi:dipeptidase E